MGTRGPVPHRDEARVRRNTPEVETTTVSVIGVVEPPPLNIVNPHELVTSLYEAMKQSAQAKFYEPSDWQVARLTLDQINRELQYQSGAIPAMKLTAFNQLLSNLMLTEGDRRRVRMEIERKPLGSVEGKVLEAADYFRQAFSQQATQPGSPSGS